MPGPYYTNSKVDDIDVIEASDLEAIETGFSNVDTDKANKNVPSTTGDFATLTATGDLGDSGKTPPSGDIVGTTDSQTLSDKTLDDTTFTGSQIDTYYTATGSGEAFDQSNGSCWRYTMNANATFTDSLSNGQFIWLELAGGNSYTATFPTITWAVSGTAPTLTANDLIILWKSDGTLYGLVVGTIV